MFNSKPFRRSRGAYAGYCTFEYFATLLITDAFLATLLTSMGISDSAIGIIMSVSSFAFLFQLISVFIAGKIKYIKPLAMVLSAASQLCYMLLYLVPFLNVSLQVKTVLVFLLILCGYMFNYITAAFIFKWGNSFVSPSKRASFSATKEMISLISGMAFSLLAGFITTSYQRAGNLQASFIFISITLLTNNICTFICLSCIKKKVPNDDEQVKIPVINAFKHLFSNKSYLKVVLMFTVKAFSLAFTIGFLGTFKTKDLFISVSTIQIINIIANLFRFIFSKPLGKYSDKHSFIKGYKLGLYLELLSFACILFMNSPEKWWIIIPFTILHYVSLAGTNANASNIIYSYVDTTYFVHATAIKNVIVGITSFTTAIFASKVFDYIQTNGNSIFGISLYPQQFLAAITIVALIITIIFIKAKIEKLEIKMQ